MGFFSTTWKFGAPQVGGSEYIIKTDPGTRVSLQDAALRSGREAVIGVTVPGVGGKAAPSLPAPRPPGRAHCGLWGPRWQGDALGCAQQTSTSTKPTPLPRAATAGGGFCSRAWQSQRSSGQGFILCRENFNSSLPSPTTPGPTALPAG